MIARTVLGAAAALLVASPAFADEPPGYRARAYGPAPYARPLPRHRVYAPAYAGPRVLVRRHVSRPVYGRVGWAPPVRYARRAFFPSARGYGHDYAPAYRAPHAMGYGVQASYATGYGVSYAAPQVESYGAEFGGYGDAGYGYAPPTDYGVSAPSYGFGTVSSVGWSGTALPLYNRPTCTCY